MASNRSPRSQPLPFRLLWVWLLALAALASGPAVARGLLAPDASIPPTELTAFVDGVITDAMASDHIAGVTVTVVQDGRAVVLKGYGVARQGQTVDAARTLFRIGSLSKTFTWIALMKEVERGRVRLDAPVNDYLPTGLRLPDQGFRRPIRVIDLMSHAAGFEDRELGHLILDDPRRVTNLEDYLARHRPDRVREPGQLASYSNYGAALAGEVAARLNAMDYPTLIEREILTPLGMADTTFREPLALRSDLPRPMPGAEAARLSDGFVWTASGFRPVGLEYISQIAPAGAGSTTAADMARYMRMQLAGGALDGVRIYDARTAAAFRTPILAVPSGVNGWAHGFMVRDMPGGVESYGHGGATQTFFTNMVLVPDLRLGVFVSTNTSTGRALAERLPKLIVERFYAPPAAGLAPGEPALLKLRHRFTGAYISTRRAYSGLEGFLNRFDSHDRVWVSPKGYLMTRTGSWVEAWVPDGAPGRFRAADSQRRLQFKLDAEGRAISYPGSRGTFTMERVGLLMDPLLFSIGAALGLAAALATMLFVFARMDRGLAQTPWQARASALALLTAGFWLAGFAAFAVWICSRGPLDGAWPDPTLVTASAAALVATLGSLGLLAMTPLVLRDGADGWSPWRKLRHLLSALVFVVFAALVGARGGLIPWA